jgi:hypothetical protein
MHKSAGRTQHVAADNYPNPRHRSTMDPKQRKSILRVLFISLLLDLVSAGGNAADCEVLTGTDLVHIYPAVVPFTALVLSKPRDSPILDLESSVTLFERIQEGVWITSEREI